jgi:hypothetical protein
MYIAWCPVASPETGLIAGISNDVAEGGMAFIGKGLILAAMHACLQILILKIGSNKL